ncbi:MAG: response regulator [Elusimicrobiota bacterium]
MSNKKILIVDDDQSCLKFYKIVCENAGFEVSGAYKKEQIVNEVKKEHDLMIIDLVLPGMETGDIIKSFNRHNKNSNIILVTGYPDMLSSVEYMMHSYIFDYLLKPVSAQKLSETLKEAFNCPPEKNEDG